MPSLSLPTCEDGHHACTPCLQLCHHSAVVALIPCHQVGALQHQTNHGGVGRQAQVAAGVVPVGEGTPSTEGLSGKLRRC
jgi:hypothetical protein